MSKQLEFFDCHPDEIPDNEQCPYFDDDICYYDWPDAIPCGDNCPLITD